MHDACVFDIKIQTVFGTGHEALDAVAMDRALDDLEAPRAIDEAELARCNARVERELAAALAEAAAEIARGDRDGARAKVKAIDARFGGLAAAGIGELDARLTGGR
jgi:hypothetical protein